MNVPRFTAEASLYKTSKLYGMTATLAATQRNVVPQLPIEIGKLCGKCNEGQ